MASTAIVALFALHIGAGAVSLICGYVAIFAPKGGSVHRAAGNVFFVGMLVMAASAAYLAVAIPDQLINVFIATFVCYLVVTAWLTVRRKERTTGVAEKAAMLVSFCLVAPFAILSFELATGMTPFLKSAVALKGPVLIAIYGFTAVLAIAVLGDAKVVFFGGIAGAPRIARHLWRMCVGLTLATGSAFTNGLARLLPGPYHVPAAFFYPQFIPLLLLVFWMIRVRLTHWRTRGEALRG
jgi:uncharacterized membrane protein